MPKKLSPQHLFFLLIALLFALYTTRLLAAHGAQVTLGWDPPAESVAGYKIHYGTTSRKYAYSIDVANFNSCTISGLADEQTY